MSELLKGQYLATPPALTDKDVSVVQIDSAGRLITTVAGVTAAMEGEYNASPVTVVDGASEELQLDVNGRLLTVPYGVYNSAAPTMSNGDKGVVQLDVNGRLNATAKLTDGTSGGYIAPASTAVAADKTALSVGLSPNSPLPAGTSTLGITMWAPVATNTNTATNFFNVGANATLNVKASAGNVLSISCINTNAAARYFQLHNTATVPSASDPPVCSWLIPAAGMVVLGSDFFTPNGMYFATGIAFAFSTTFLTYTAGTAGEQVTCVRFK